MIPPVPNTVTTASTNGVTETVEAGSVATLSSIFTAPSSCSSSWTYEASTYNGIERGLLMQNVLFSDRNLDCFPSPFIGAGRGTYYQTYSPGLCPDGYTTLGAFTTESTTTATCCYDGFTLGSRDDFTGCLSSFTGSTKVPDRVGGFGEDDATSSTEIEGSFTMWAQPIVIAYEESESSQFSTSAPTSTSPIEPKEPAPSSGGLSGGHIAGIVVGSIVGVSSLVGVAFWLGRRKRHRAQQDRPYLPNELPPTTQQQGYQQKDRPDIEMDTSQSYRHELPGY